jgi:hypothetical protein
MHKEFTVYTKWIKWPFYLVHGHEITIDHILTVLGMLPKHARWPMLEHHDQERVIKIEKKGG